MDHQHGLVTGFAIDKGVDLWFDVRDDSHVHLESKTFEGLVDFEIDAPSQVRERHWGDYARGAKYALKKRFELKYGINGVIQGSLPVGGLSSSAAVLIAYVMAFAKANDITLQPFEVVKIASEAEREYIGLNNGLLDQACIALSKKDQLLFLDCDSNEYRLIPFGGQMESVKGKEALDLGPQTLDCNRRWKKPITIIDDGSTTNDNRLGAVCDLLLALSTPPKQGELEGVLVVAADNLLFFSFQEFVDFAKAKGTSCIMCHEQPSIEKLQRTGVVELDENNKVLGMEEKPEVPKSHWAVPPFYIYRKEDLDLVRHSVENGCGKDAPGNLAHYMVEHTTMHAWPMSAGRFDIGSLDTYYEAVEKYGK